MSWQWPEVERRSRNRRRRDRRADAVNSRRVHIGLLLAAIAVIVYVALYPFQWQDRPDDQVGAVASLLSTIGDADQADRPDLILLYVPFGFLAMYALPVSLPGQVRAMGTFAAATLLSMWIELAQYQTVGHVTTMGDVYASLAGTVLGLLGAVAAQRRRWSLTRMRGWDRVVLILLLLWAGDQLYPYLPVANPYSVADIVTPLLAVPGADPLAIGRAVVRWLMVAWLAETLGAGHWVRWFTVLALGAFAARVLVAGQVLPQPFVLGAVIAFVLWLGLRHLAPGRLLLAMAFAALIVVVRLAPFAFVPLPQSFGWLPFQSLIASDPAQIVHALCADGFLYGGLIWLLHRNGLPMAGATALTVVLVLVIAGAQCWTTGPPGEATDALIAAIIGSVLFLLGGRATAEG